MEHIVRKVNEIIENVEPLYIKPNPIEYLESDNIRQLRFFDCKYYGTCLTVASILKWKTFTCEHCKISLLYGSGIAHTVDRRYIDISIEIIQRKVSVYFKIKLSDIKGLRRFNSISHPRQIAMYLSRKFTNHSFPEIGQRFDRHHATVIHACKHIEHLLKYDNCTKIAIESIEHQLLSTN